MAKMFRYLLMAIAAAAIALSGFQVEAQSVARNRASTDPDHHAQDCPNTDG